MCGILAILGVPPEKNNNQLRQHILKLSRRLRHRGPDWSGVHLQKDNIFCHERLAIVDLETGEQPLFNEDKKICLVVNGEIYNHKELEAQLKQKHSFRTKSDCEVIIHLWEEMGEDFVDLLSGDFAFVISDGDKYLVARDPIGVCPLYMGWGADGSIWFASELKALKEDCPKIEAFPPGHIYSSQTGKYKRYYNPSYLNGHVPTLKPDLMRIRNALIQAVKKRLMSDVPYGVLLSGGLDSSLVASIASRYAAGRIEEDSKTKAWWPQIHSFSIGVSEKSPDLIKAKEVADFIGTIHHEFHFSVQEGIDAISDVIWHLETYDVTTIRASTPMYLLSRRIKALGVKMVLSGEGADEIFGGYLYFFYAKSKEEFHKETVRRVELLHTADCLRANKSTMAWGLEARVPFLDKDFLDVAFSFDPEEKLFNQSKMEKSILRKAFEDKENPFLPDSILWRQKEQFSDGVGYSWIDGLIAHAELEVKDSIFQKREELYPEDTPKTKEAFWYRFIFELHFPQKTVRDTVKTWVPTWGQSTDPSGRAQKVHVAHKADLEKEIPS